MKCYQLVNNETGQRSEMFMSSSLADLAADLVAQEVSVDFYVLVLLEDADGKPYVSRAPMMTVRSVVRNFCEVK